MRTGAIAVITAIAIVVVMVGLISIASDVTWNVAVSDGDGGTVKTSAPATGDGSEGAPVTIERKGVTHDYLAEHAVEPSNMDGYTSADPANCVMVASTASTFACRRAEDITPDNPATHKTLTGYTKVAPTNDGLTITDKEFGATTVGDIFHWRIDLNTTDTLELEKGERIRFTKTDATLYVESNIRNVSYTPSSGAGAVATITLETPDVESTGAAADITSATGTDWQIVRIGSGLEYCRTSADFTGDCTPSDPLGAASSLRNAPRLVKFDAVDSDIASHENSEIGFYSGSAQIVNTSITGANRIYIPLKAAPFGTNASDANTPQGELDDVDLQPFFNDRLDNGGQIMLAINKHGTGDYTYVQADTIAAHGSTGWLLTALTWYGAAQMATGSGWDIVAGDGGIFTKDIIDRDRLVFRADLEGRETDRYLSYNSSHSGYWPGAMAFYNQSSGIPTAANIVGQTSLADGTLTLGLGRLRTDRDPLNLVWDSNTCPVAADYAVGDAIYISSWRTPSNHATFTITSAAVQTGTGNGCYVYMAGTLSGAAAIAPVTAIGDYLLLAEEVPTQVQVEIPFSDVLDPPWVRTDGTNATDALEAAIQGCDETITLTGTYERRAGTPIAKGQWYIPATPTRTGQQQLVIAFKDTDLGRIVDCWITDAWIEIGGYEMEVVDSANFFQKSINAYQGAVVLGPENTGTIPSVGDSDTGKIIGEDVHRGQLDDIAFTGLQRHGTALPSTCAVGLVFLLTAASGNNTAGLYACLAANTWTAVGP